MLQTTERKWPKSWKALLAIGVAAGAVIWQIMACMESPMSFSASGDLAFTVMDPYVEESKPAVAGKATYRLLVLGTDRQMRELERSSSHMLVAAGYSPGGERLAYLRIALPSEKDLERAEAFNQRLMSADPKVKAEALKEGWFFLVPPATDRAPKPFHEAATDLGSAPVKSQAGEIPAGGALLPGELVLRDAGKGTVIWTRPFDLPYKIVRGQDYPLASVQPQPLAEGGGIYVHWQFSLIADVPQREVRLFASALLPGRLSPDGRTLATLDKDGKTLQLSATDGGRAVWVRLNRKEVAWGGLAWAGRDTVAVLSRDAPGEFAVDFFDRDGHRLRSLTLALGAATLERTELAIAPDGRHMVIVPFDGGTVHFLGADGKRLGEWTPPSGDEILVRATFSPDSKQVAFRHMTEGEDKKVHTAAIVFFSPEGKELFRVPVPPAPPPALPPEAAAPPAAASEAPAQ